MCRESEDTHAYKEHQPTQPSTSVQVIRSSFCFYRTLVFIWKNHILYVLGSGKTLSYLLPVLAGL